MIRALEAVKAYLRVPFTVIVWMMETYSKNRLRLRIYMAQSRTKTMFKWAITVTMLAWIVIALIAREDQGQRLNDAIQGGWADTQSLFDERKTLEQKTVPTH